jgi:hypothetical protein
VVQPVERQEARRAAQLRDERLARLGLAALVGELVEPGVRAGDVHHVVQGLVQHDDERESEADRRPGVIVRELEGPTGGAECRARSG